MVEYKTKSVIVGRKRDLKHELVAFISLFDVNDPHTSGEAPTEVLEFHTNKIYINGLDIFYMIEGNDIIINDLTSIKVEDDGNNHIILTGKHK